MELERVKLHALLFDDHDGIRRLLARVLKDAGFEVTPLASEQETLARIETGGFDLLILEYNLGVRSSEEIAKRVKEVQSAIPVFMLCASDGTRAQELIAEGSVDALFPKPIDLNKFRQNLQALIDSRSSPTG